MREEVIMVILIVLMMSVIGLSFAYTSQFKENQREFCNSHGLEFVDWTTSTTSCFDKVTGNMKVFQRDNS